jgi:hypothetical protein
MESWTPGMWMRVNSEDDKNDGDVYDFREKLYSILLKNYIVALSVIYEGTSLPPLTPSDTCEGNTMPPLLPNHRPTSDFFQDLSGKTASKKN